MPGTWFPGVSCFFDYLHDQWERPRTQRSLGLILLAVYLIILLAVELRRMGFWPAGWPQLPTSHFFAIELAFTLILGLEVISLIFVLPESLSRSMAKQFEILTMILLRNAFKELSLLPEPVHIGNENILQICQIAANGTGALCVFLCLGLYRRYQHRHRLAIKPDLVRGYVQSKKLLALCLLAIFIGIGCYDLRLAFQGIGSHFFETIYTVLIFADIAMVLIAQRYMPCYYAVFRNSGFVVGTLLMRLSLSAPPFLGSALAVFAALYVLGLTLGTNLFGPEPEEE